MLRGWWAEICDRRQGGMMRLADVLWILREVALSQRIVLVLLMVAGSLTEGIGLLLLLPLLMSLQGEAVPPWMPSALVAHPGILLAAGLALLLARNALVYAREQAGVVIQQTLVDGLRQRCFRALLQVEWRWLVERRRSDHASLLLTDIARVGTGTHHALALLAGVAALLAGLLAAAVLSWPMTLLAVSTGLVLVLLLAGHRRQAVQLGQELTQANRSLHASVQESLQGIKVTRLLGAESLHRQAFDITLEHMRQRHLGFARNSSRVRALYQSLAALLLVAYLYAGLIWLTMPVAELLVLVVIFARLIPLVVHIQSMVHLVLHALPALSEVRRFLEQMADHAEPALAGGQGPFSLNVALELHDVCVNWPDRAQPALDRISLRLPARTTTAVIGPSGAGKSTLADVLCGLLAPDAGQLRVDGQLIEGEQRRRWRTSVACVPQEVVLMHDTIASNLRWADPDADEQQLEHALRRAAAEFVFSLPQGVNTVIGDNGVQLSGGERQRLALARALLQRPALLILDEATSALDVDNEQRVRAAIEQLHGDLTVLVIGHRLPTLEHADQVVVLEQGRIRACGSWQEVRALRSGAG